MPYYCTVPRCTSMAGKAKNVSFHQFPRDEDLAKLWNDILKRGKPYTKYSKVCSLHFRPEDYTITSVGKNKGQWRTLRKDAIPSRNLPSEAPATSMPQRSSSSSWTPSVPTIDTQMQQQMAQAIYLQTMLAMQAANGTPFPMQPFDPTKLPTKAPPTDANLSELEKILMRNNTKLTVNPQNSGTIDSDTRNGSYKCEQCTKCFKDPDVFLIHQRTHVSNQDTQGKENVANDISKETLRANPILTNLLNNDVSKLPENFNKNSILHLENHLLTALTANLQSYISNYKKLMQNDDSSDKFESDDDGSVNSTNLNNMCGYSLKVNRVRDEADNFVNNKVLEKSTDFLPDGNRNSESTLTKTDDDDEDEDDEMSNDQNFLHEHDPNDDSKSDKSDSSINNKDIDKTSKIESCIADDDNEMSNASEDAMKDQEAYNILNNEEKLCNSENNDHKAYRSDQDEYENDNDFKASSSHDDEMYSNEDDHNTYSGVTEDQKSYKSDNDLKAYSDHNEVQKNNIDDNNSKEDQKLNEDLESKNNDLQAHSGQEKLYSGLNQESYNSKKAYSGREGFNGSDETFSNAIGAPNCDNEDLKISNDNDLVIEEA